MQKTLEKFITDNETGLFLLDSPTGFGKTTAVLNILKEFLNGVKFNNVKRMFYVTNLKTNLPSEDLLNMLSPKEQAECIRLRAYDEEVIANWKDILIPIKEIKFSKEYKALNLDVEISYDLKQEKEVLISHEKSIVKMQKAIDSFQKKIATVSEPAFRQFIQKNYLWGKSVVEKNKFIRENSWFGKL